MTHFYIELSLATTNGYSTRRINRKENDFLQVKFQFQQQNKVFLCVWWDYIGIIHFELLKSGLTINDAIYCDKIKPVTSQIDGQTTSVGKPERGNFRADNARPHSARMTQEKTRQLGWKVLSHPPYSSDMAPSEFYLFRSFEHNLRNRSFTDIDGVNYGLTAFLESKDSKFFKNGIEKLEEH